MSHNSLNVDGTVAALSISQIKGEKKSNIPSARFIAGHGIDGDAHAGDWHRQVSLLAAESIAKIKAALPDLADGDAVAGIEARYRLAQVGPDVPGEVIRRLQALLREAEARPRNDGSPSLLGRILGDRQK